MDKFIEVYVNDQKDKIFVNVSHIVKISSHFSTKLGCILVTPELKNGGNFIHTSHTYEELKKMILGCHGLPDYDSSFDYGKKITMVHHEGEKYYVSGVGSIERRNGE